MASALDNHVHEIKSQNGTTFELENAEKKLHAEMKLALSEKNYEIYNIGSYSSTMFKCSKLTLGFEVKPYLYETTCIINYETTQVSFPAWLILDESS